jgi:NitT/TauT family transport system substrate-binding protein
MPDDLLCSDDIDARRRRLLGASALALLAGCSAPLPRLRVGSIVFPGYELLFVARELGLLDESRLRLIEMHSNTDTMRALATGRLEAAALTLDEAMTQRADGVDLRVLAVLDVSDGADVVLSRRPLASLSELAGKRIGVEDGAAGAVMLGALLDAAGLSPGMVVKVPMMLDGSVEAYRSGKVDAIVSAEPWAAQIEAEGGVRIFDSRAIPNRIVDVLVARADVLQSQGAALRQLLAGHFLALKLLREQPDKAARLMAARMELQAAEVLPTFRGLKLPDAAENRSLLGPGGGFARSVQELLQQMLAQGLLRRSIALAELVDMSFLPA